MSDTLSIQTISGVEMLVWKNIEENVGRAFDVNSHAAPAAMIGKTVIPGPDWKWGRQGGRRPVGLVTHFDPEIDGWIWVRWKNGDRNAYRWGADDAFDLKVKKTSFFRRFFSKR